MNTILYFHRFGGLRNRRVLETHSRSLEEAPHYPGGDDNVSVGGFSLDQQDWEHRSWCSAPVAPVTVYHDHDQDYGQYQHNGHHRRLPPTPRRPSTLLSVQVTGQNSNNLGTSGQSSLLNQQNIQQHNLQNQHQQAPVKSTGQASSSSIFDKVSNFKQSLLPSLTGGLGSSLPAGSPATSFGVNSILTVKSERNERDQFTRSGVNPNFINGSTAGAAQVNGTYSSHPNLISTTQAKQVNNNTTTTINNTKHRQLPAVPRQPSSLKLSTWRQSSLPEQRNPPGHDPDIPAPASDRLNNQRRYQPPTPAKPSTLSIRQSNTSHLHSAGASAHAALNYSFFGNGQSYQMPKLNCSPSSLFNSVTGRTDTMVHFTGMNSGQHRTLPPTENRRQNLTLGRTLPLPPPPPPAPPSPPSQHNKQNNNTAGFNGLSGVFHRNSQEIDWI